MERKSKIQVGSINWLIMATGYEFGRNNVREVPWVQNDIWKFWDLNNQHENAY